jgi:hypothetical protein
MSDRDWRPIPGHCDYEVSDDGVIRNVHTGNMARPKTVNQYPYVVIRNSEGLASGGWVHLFVASAFLPPKPHPRAFIDHKDTNKFNSAADNLRWVTPAMNTKLAALNGALMRGEENGAARLTAREVIAIQISKESNRELARIYGVNPSTISRVRSGKQRKHG